MYYFKFSRIKGTYIVYFSARINLILLYYVICQIRVQKQQ